MKADDEPSQRLGGRHARQSRRYIIWLDIISVLLVTCISDIVAFSGNSNVPYAQVVGGVAGLVGSIVTPGFVIVGGIYPKTGQLSHLLRWVLVLSASCFYDVLLSLVLSGLGVRLTPQSVVATETITAVTGCFWIVWARLRIGANGEQVHSWREGARFAPVLLVGGLVFLAVFFILLPNLETSPPVLYITTDSGQLAMPYVSSGSRIIRMQVHVRNPGPRSIRFVLSEYVDGRRQGDPFHIRVEGNGMWTRDVIVSPPASHGRVSFLLSDPNIPSDTRKVWFSYGSN